MSRIIFVSDTLTILNRYRSNLIGAVAKKHKTEQYSVISLSGLRSIIPPWNRVIVASNLKTNLFVAVFCTTKTLFILNGLGRYQESRVLRALLIRIINRRKRSHFAIQSYRDYRYFRKLVTIADNISWIPGSGGTRRAIGTSKSIIFVSRASKYPIFRNKVALFSAQGNHVNIVGVEGKNSNSVHYMGYQEQHQLFLTGSKFLALSGYGEGIPHSLVDAIVSGMCITIERRLYIDAGFYNYDNCYTKSNIDGLQLYDVSKWDDRLIENISINHVTYKYTNLVEGLI